MERPTYRYATRNQNALNFALPHDAPSEEYSNESAEALHQLLASLAVLQTAYFPLWLGDWTEAIDWTGAVINTHLTAALSSLSHSLNYTFPSAPNDAASPNSDAHYLENEINKYFTQSVAYYYTEDYLSIRNQAFDDMLWVVLGWLESTRFVDAHSKMHYPPSNNLESPTKGDWWHARQFIPPFAHRARVFYELAEQGWDDKLCGGGMTWNPALLPYKNAVTNQLFIAASVGMYLYFPGDDNDSPFLTTTYGRTGNFVQMVNGSRLRREHGLENMEYLEAAVKGYDWLANINMTNNEGLYVDGYHIAGLSTNSSKTECDERNEMVYTYNQGIILSGLRGLWEATGNATYLEDGHALVGNVLRATGWGTYDEEDSSYDLGTEGILTEACDPTGDCNQDAQTFKGIFFHHFTAFCAPLASSPLLPSIPSEIEQSHDENCTSYTPWVILNAEAAMRTRNEEGKFGGWWGVVDDEDVYDDPNDRGRGRTVETQSSGLAVVRAMYEFLTWYGDFDKRNR